MYAMSVCPDKKAILSISCIALAEYPDSQVSEEGLGNQDNPPCKFTQRKIH